MCASVDAAVKRSPRPCVSGVHASSLRIATGYQDICLNIPLKIERARFCQLQGGDGGEDFRNGPGAEQGSRGIDTAAIKKRAAPTYAATSALTARTITCGKWGVPRSPAAQTARPIITRIYAPTRRTRRCKSPLECVSAVHAITSERTG